MGHRDLRTTRGDAHDSPSHEKSAIQRLRYDFGHYLVTIWTPGKVRHRNRHLRNPLRRNASTCFIDTYLWQTISSWYFVRTAGARASAATPQRFARRRLPPGPRPFLMIAMAKGYGDHYLDGGCVEKQDFSHSPIYFGSGIRSQGRPAISRSVPGAAEDRF